MKAAVGVGIPDVRGKVRHSAIVLCHQWSIGTVATPVECQRVFSAVDTNQLGSPCRPSATLLSTLARGSARTPTFSDRSPGEIGCMCAGAVNGPLSPNPSNQRMPVPLNTVVQQDPCDLAGPLRISNCPRPKTTTHSNGDPRSAQPCVSKGVSRTARGGDAPARATQEERSRTPGLSRVARGPRVSDKHAPHAARKPMYLSLAGLLGQYSKVATIGAWSLNSSHSDLGSASHLVKRSSSTRTGDANR